MKKGAAGMKIDVFTIFPQMFTGPLTESLIKKAQDRKIVDIKIHNLRSFSMDKHKSIDDRPFGGGPGMVFKPEPLYKALKSVGAAGRRAAVKWPKNKRQIVIHLSPQGKLLNQKTVLKLTEYKNLVILCSHYEGIDERVLDWVNLEVSIGDYVLTGGEIPAMVLIDGVVRFLPGVVKEAGSLENDSFMKGCLDYPHYTRPAVFKGLKVPKVLMSGNHRLVDEWRRKQALINTRKKRPDLLKK
jgi:tRNA (guanine37-N1)-methyltransferase